MNSLLAPTALSPMQEEHSGQERERVATQEQGSVRTLHALRLWSFYSPNPRPFGAAAASQLHKALDEAPFQAFKNSPARARCLVLNERLSAFAAAAAPNIGNGTILEIRGRPFHMPVSCRGPVARLPHSGSPTKAPFVLHLVARLVACACRLTLICAMGDGVCEPEPLR